MVRPFYPLLFLFWVLLAFASFAAKAAELPALTSRVVDNAALLSASQAQTLRSRLEAHERSNGHQFVIATIRSLEGEDIEGFANRLFRHWALGDKERNDGVLLLVAKDDRKLRIEVGYGLEGTLTDALASHIIRNDIVPAFKRGEFATGIEAGAATILKILAADEAALEDWQNQTDGDDGFDINWPPVLFFSIWLYFLVGLPILNAMIRRFGKKLAPGHYRWLGMEARPPSKRKPSSNSGWSSGSSWGSSSGGGFSGGGGSSGGGGASGGW